MRRAVPARTAPSASDRSRVDLGHLVGRRRGGQENRPARGRAAPPRPARRSPARASTACRRGCRWRTRADRSPQVDIRPRSAKRASTLKTSPTRIRAAPVQPGQLEVAPRAGVGLGPTSTANHLARAAAGGRDRDRAGVAEQVQHSPAGRPAGDRRRPPQIGEQADRERRRDVHREAQIPSRTSTSHRAGWRGPARRGRGGASPPSGFIRCCRRCRPASARRPARCTAAPPSARRAGVDLADQVVGVAIDEQRRQAVALAVHQAHACSTSKSM